MNNKKREPHVKSSQLDYTTKKEKGEKIMKRIFKTLKNILILASMIVAIALLIHDFVFWGIIPFFSHTFYEMTYLGLLVDFTAIGIVEVSIQYFKELFK